MEKGYMESVIEQVLDSATDSPNVDMTELEKINIFLEKAKPFLIKQPYDIGEPPYAGTQQNISFDIKNIQQF